jgi:hypothetical protein
MIQLVKLVQRFAFDVDRANIFIDVETHVDILMYVYML